MAFALLGDDFYRWYNMNTYSTQRNFIIMLIKAASDILYIVNVLRSYLI